MFAEPDARRLDVARLVDAAGDQHRVMCVRAAPAGSTSSPDLEVQMEVDAAVAQQLGAALDDFLLQLEVGDAVDHQAADAVIAVIDMRPGSPCGASCSAAARPAGPAPMMPTDSLELARRLHRLDPAFLPGGVGDVLLDRADGDRAVARLLDDAIAFAEPVLRTDAAADLREVVGGGGDLIGLLQPALGGQLQPVGDVVMDAGNGPGRRARRIASSGWPGPRLPLACIRGRSPGSRARRADASRFRGMARPSLTNCSILPTIWRASQSVHDQQVMANSLPSLRSIVGQAYMNGRPVAIRISEI